MTKKKMKQQAYIYLHQQEFSCQEKKTTKKQLTQLAVVPWRHKHSNDKGRRGKYAKSKNDFYDLMDVIL